MNKFNTPLRVAYAASGSGSTFEYIASQVKNGTITGVENAVLIASKADIGAIKIAEKLQIDHQVINFKDTDSGLQIIGHLKDYGIKIWSQNGLLPITPKGVIQYVDQNGIIALNQHPGILRAYGNHFGGKGMHGTYVTAATVIYHLMRGTKDSSQIYTESSVHRLTENIDEGVLVASERLVFGDKIDAFREKYPVLIDAFEAPEGKADLYDLIKQVQKELLDLEYINCAGVIAKLGRGEKLERHPYFDQVLERDLRDEFANERFGDYILPLAKQIAQEIEKPEFSTETITLLEELLGNVEMIYA